VGSKNITGNVVGEERGGGVWREKKDEKGNEKKHACGKEKGSFNRRGEGLGEKGCNSVEVRKQNKNKVDGKEKRS